MIGKIAGRVDYVAEDHVLIDTGGVGYELWCSVRALGALPPPGEVAALYTTLVVRDDLLQLFGFETREEREWHRLLTSVQGVGAKVGLAILGAIGPDGAGRAIALGDVAAMRKAPGVGPKLAQRIVMELKGKAPAMMALGDAAPATAPDSAEDDSFPVKVASARPRADALSALVNLGYQEGEAAAAVATAEMEADTEADAAALIRAALKTLAKGR